MKLNRKEIAKIISLSAHSPRVFVAEPTRPTVTFVWRGPGVWATQVNGQEMLLSDLNFTEYLKKTDFWSVTVEYTVAGVTRQSVLLDGILDESKKANFFGDVASLTKAGLDKIPFRIAIEKKK